VKKASKGKVFIVIDVKRKEFLSVGSIFYRTKSLEEATKFETKEQALEKIKKEGITNIVECEVIEMEIE
jgi:hypothetical protein